MLSDRVSQFLSIKVTGRVFMLCNNEGVKKTTQIRRYENEVRQILEQKALEGVDLDELETLLQTELKKLRGRIRGEEVETEQETPLPKKPLLKKTQSKKTSPEQSKPATAVVEETKPKAVRSDKQTRQAGAYKPHSAALHEKLEMKRKPLSELLQKDCVHLKLLTPARGKYWAHNLTGRMIDEVESDIVSELAQNFHDNIKKYMRKNRRSHPWQTPRLQEQLRADIHAVKTIKGMLELCSQINREIQQSEDGQQKSIIQKWLKKIF